MTVTITEEQAIEALRQLANARRKQLEEKVKVLPGFTPKPQETAYEKGLRTIQGNHRATLERLGRSGQGLSLNLKGYPLKINRNRNPIAKHVREQLLKDNPTCAYCPEPAKTLDHIVPRARGGNNKTSNLVPACFQCNQLKSCFLPNEIGFKMKLPLRAFDKSTKVR